MPRLGFALILALLAVASCTTSDLGLELEASPSRYGDADPQYFGDRHPGIEPITDTLPSIHTELWVLTHEDLRRTARVSTLLRFIASELTQARELPHKDRIEDAP